MKDQYKLSSINGIVHLNWSCCPEFKAADSREKNVCKVCASEKLAGYKQVIFNNSNITFILAQVVLVESTDSATERVVGPITTLMLFSKFWMPV
jgi:hypothetical protein